MKIDGREIGSNSKPYIIAEVSANHNGSLDRALNLIRLGKQAGADAIKLQTYTPDSLTIDAPTPDFLIHGGLWDKRTLYDLYSEAQTPWDWHEALFEEARNQDITMFSSPFDADAIDLLETLNCPAYKIASFEIIDLALIRKAASTGKPLIISTGLANRDEIREAVETARESGASEIALLHCLSSYPAPPSHYKLGTIPVLRQDFGCEIGLSDHTIGNDVAIASVALGASLVEKHFTLDRNGNGPDDSFSMDVDGLAALRSSLDVAWSSLGFDDFKIQESEKENLRFRRSLYFVRNVALGEVISESDVRSIRPGYGVAPKNLSRIIGVRCPIDVVRGQRVTQDFLDLCTTGHQ